MKISKAIGIFVKIDTNVNFDKNTKFDKNINFDKSINFDTNINFDKNINIPHIPHLIPFGDLGELSLLYQKQI